MKRTSPILKYQFGSLTSGTGIALYPDATMAFSLSSFDRKIIPNVGGEDKKRRRRCEVEMMEVIDEALDACIKKLRNATTGHEVRIFVSEYEELMLKKAKRLPALL